MTWEGKKLSEISGPACRSFVTNNQRKEIATEYSDDGKTFHSYNAYNTVAIMIKQVNQHLLEAFTSAEF